MLSNGHEKRPPGRKPGRHELRLTACRVHAHSNTAAPLTDAYEIEEVLLLLLEVFGPVPDREHLNLFAAFELGRGVPPERVNPWPHPRANEIRREQALR